MSRGETEREESVQHHDTQAAPLTYVPWSRYGRKYRNVSLSLRLNLSGSDCSYTPLTFWLICACGCVQISWNELVKDEFRMMVDECMIYSVTSSVRWGCKVEGSAVLEDATENETSLKRFVETDCWFTARSVSHFTELNRIYDADYEKCCVLTWAVRAGRLTAPVWPAEVRAAVSCQRLTVHSLSLGSFQPQSEKQGELQKYTQHAHYRRVSLTFIQREWKTDSNRANVESCSFSPDNNVFNRWAFYNIGALNPEYTLNLPHRLISPPSLPRSWRSPPTTVLRWSANKPPEMKDVCSGLIVLFILQASSIFGDARTMLKSNLQFYSLKMYFNQLSDVSIIH